MEYNKYSKCTKTSKTCLQFRLIRNGKKPSNEEKRAIEMVMETIKIIQTTKKTYENRIIIRSKTPVNLLLLNVRLGLMFRTKSTILLHVYEFVVVCIIKIWHLIGKMNKWGWRRALNKAVLWLKTEIQ